MPLIERWLTILEASRESDRHPIQIQKWISAGILPTRQEKQWPRRHMILDTDLLEVTTKHKKRNYRVRPVTLTRESDGYVQTRHIPMSTKEGTGDDR